MSDLHNHTMDLTEDEADLIRLLRTREAEITALSQTSQVEREQWEAEHPGEHYAALMEEGSAGARAYSLCATTCAEMATAAFDLAARRLGITGWQGSYAELEFLRRSRRIEGPFGIYQVSDALYPQYDVVGRVQKVMDDPATIQWLGDEAEKMLASSKHAADTVIAHWHRLVQARDAQVVRG